MARTSAVVLSLMVLCAAASAQGYGWVIGTVVDNLGSPVVGAVVTFHIAYGEAGGGCGGGGSGGGGCGGGSGGCDSVAVVGTVTDESGAYAIAEIPVGTGCAKACKPGLGNHTVEVTIVEGANTYNFQLPGCNGGGNPFNRRKAVKN